MNRHVEVVRLELVGHFSKALETVLPHCLLKAECLSGLTALLWGKITFSVIGIYIMWSMHKEGNISNGKDSGNKPYLSNTLWASPVPLGHIL